MDHYNILDLGFWGPKYTWTNKRGIGHLIQERLDRCWATPSWKALFSEASVSHLARINSNHCLLLLKITDPPPASGERPFRFQTMWNHHPDFQDLVSGAWRENALDRAIHEFTIQARKWNKEVFGNIFWGKRQLAARLLGIQKALANNPNAFLLNLQVQLSDEFN